MWSLSGLRLWVFFDLSSLGRLAMSTEVLGTQTWIHKLRKEREACLQKTGAGRLLKYGRPAGLGGLVLLPASAFFQHDHSSSMTSLSTCYTSCTAQTLSSTPFLALLVLPLDASCFESCPCSLSPLASHATMKFLQSHACCPPMLVLCMWS
jgi:hypothetical protein